MNARFLCGQDLFATVLATLSTLENMQAETVETESTFPGQAFPDGDFLHRQKRTVTVPVFV
jgi:hypothetical protein